MGLRAWTSLSTKPRKGTSAQNHEKSKFSRWKLWVYFEQQKSVRVCFACDFRLSMFNVSSSKSISSTSRGTLHFTRQPRSCELAPTLRQFHFQTSVSSTIVPVHHLYFTSDVLKMIVCQMKPNECYQYQIDGNQWAAKNCVCASFAHKYRKSSKIQ